LVAETGFEPAIFVDELMIGLTEYFAFYNIQRPHESLGQITPDVVYRSGIGGGAMILDKYL
jgi:putative transposase